MKGSLSWAELRSARRSLKEVARREGKTLNEVRENIMEAIAEMKANPEPGPRARWAASPFADRIPSPEEFVVWCAKMVKEMELKETVSIKQGKQHEKG